jgi:hypothetical protein
LSISTHAQDGGYTETISYFNRRIQKIKFLQRMLEDGRSIIMSPTDKKALDYFFPLEPPLPSDEERLHRRAMKSQIERGTAKIYTSFLNTKQNSKKSSVL